MAQAGGVLVGPVGSVEADDGVEVDLAALLVFGDLGVGERGVVAQGALGESGARWRSRGAGGW